MKILFLNPVGNVGGAETSLLCLMGALREIEPTWQLELLLGSKGPLEGLAQKLGVQTTVLEFPAAVQGLGESGGSAGVGGGLKAIAALWSYRQKLSQAIAAIAPDVIHSNGLKMHVLSAVARRGKARLVGHIHDYVSHRRLSRHLMGQLAGKFDTLVANSNDVAQDCHFWAGQTSRVRMVYNAVDPQRFRPDGARLDLDSLSQLPPAPEGALRVGLMATFAHWKGHRTFLKAIQELGDEEAVRFYILGGPIYATGGSQLSLEELKQEARELGIEGRVGFTGFIADTASALRSLDIVVHASTKPEPFGMVIIEGMACGKAVVAADAGGAKELLANGTTGVPHQPGDPSSLAAALRRLIENSELRSGIAGRGLDFYHKQFTARRMGEEFRNVYIEARG